MQRSRNISSAIHRHPRWDLVQRRSTWSNPASWFASSRPDAVIDTPLASRPTIDDTISSNSQASTSNLAAASRNSPAPAPTPTPAFTSINASEISHFSRLSSQWWDEKGEFGLLHKMNPVRMEFVRNKIVSGREDDDGWSFASRKEARKDYGQTWLEGMDVLDVGCGGGLLSEVRIGLISGLTSREKIAKLTTSMSSR